MASKLYIKEFQTLPGSATQIWDEPGLEQTPLALTSTAATSAVFNPKTRYVCITSDMDTAYVNSAAGATTAVTGTHFPLWSRNYICFSVRPGDAISAVLWT